ncbi:superoxide dismutase [Campylobacter hyointestinalis]|uniref:superoxide dismutase n=1 Tax=Campylobacter hyointestinalis TaxID=198 RepID=UPI000CE4F3FB|nr:superoxide dismutase [Campylobacter hyointestinalis]PPB71924.1 superoxide dismutase [Campylobacter hyointestinalis subsp. hyointestinalis]PPB74761.1 superoxide dismutase [Campylobacter hyointestinalis subsp. hyointestinalis]PPB76472.1 superoxide dismutase [Campylobacter hyointestinalis subsp. hyointestinalis]PPB77336.1 superoxide dismutase [Campylobacter hyointestinalis subsp. hyointestinalis]
MFELRKLPFDPKNNGVISEETCNFHYGKHHQAYINNLNNLIKNTKFENESLFDIITMSDDGIFNNAAQIYNHDFYWDCIAVKSGISSELQADLQTNFSDFRSEFIKNATTLFGSGWTWLVYDPSSEKLSIKNTSNASNPITYGLVPLLVVDVWEHAYYIDVKNARAVYLEKFYENINWKFVSDAYEWAKKEGLNSVRFYMDEIYKRSGCCGDHCQA